MSFEEVMIPAEGGVELHAWVFRPEGFEGPRPAITMAHGFGGIKYVGLKAYAELFAEHGYVVVVHDHRGFGFSGGDIRGDIDPWQQIADWRRVISYTEALEEVDPTRIGLWGSSYAGGHAFVLGATDRRLKAIVSQIPTISGYEQGLRRIPEEFRAMVEAKFDADERAQLNGEPPAMQLMLSADPNVPAVYHSQDAIDLIGQFEYPEGISTDEFVTVRSSRRAMMYEPGAWVPRVSPTPVLMVVASQDTVTPTEMQLEAYEKLHEPKRLELYEGGHFDAYVNQFEKTSGAALKWFLEHLAP
ncbi:alpha/beta hydrolase [Cognatishimia activa]|uniref:alpha/beta hydrolase n=1 Tax=Cognatishimia activa TaxID=1715691 RepID=UPI002231B8CD|nr:alpha/beta hydrolase [Cognatishimia activa]UZD91475.1 alpha/beta hydrolase [Cognatishimia activa]